MTQKSFLQLLLPIIVFHIAYLMSVIQGHIQEFPIPDGPSIPLPDFSIGRYLYKLATSLPEIILSYIYLILCRNNMRYFKIITPAFLLGYIFLLAKSSPIGLTYISLLVGLHYWIPFFLLFMIYFVRNDQKKWIQYVSLGLSITLLFLTYFVSVSGIPASDTSFWSKIHRIYWIVIYLISYLLCQFQKCNILWGICVILILSASLILEFYTPLDYILVTMCLIVFIMFGTEMLVRHYTKKDKENQEKNK